MSGGEEAEAEPGAGGAIPAAPSPPTEEGDTRQRYEELCSSLNMDERARSEAWLSYQSMKRNYTLEVRPGPGGGVKGGGRRGGGRARRHPLPLSRAGGRPRAASLCPGCGRGGDLARPGGVAHARGGGAHNAAPCVARCQI